MSYEAIGIVEEVGSDVDRIRAGAPLLIQFISTFRARAGVTTLKSRSRGLRTDMQVVRRVPCSLYLTTIGRVTGQPREIEIWFTEHGGRFYLVAERESANWVRNIQSQPQVKVRVSDAEINAIARVVDNGREPQLAVIVKALFDAKYGWSDGLMVELTPA